MNYQFPEIRHIDDIRAATEGFSEFIFAQREDVIFVQYGIMNRDLFSLTEDPLLGAIRRELRGIAFDANTGRLLSRPFHKFKNLNESDEVQFDNIDWTRPHKALVKLDGSMVRPVRVNGKMHLATKMGYLGPSVAATEYMDDNTALSAKILDAYENNVTPIFEWTSPKDQIVIAYDRPQLTLLAVRDNLTGAYLDDDFGIPVERVREHEDWNRWNGDTWSKVEKLAAKTGEEGVVVWFDNGHAVKIKNYWYHNVHKLVSEIGVRDVRRHIVKLILNEQYDDLLQFLGPDKMKIVTEFHDLFWEGIDATTRRLQYMLWAAKEKVGDDMKRFAKEIGPTIKDATDKKILFQCAKGKDVREEIMKHVDSSTVRDNQWDNAQRWLTGQA